MSICDEQTLLQCYGGSLGVSLITLALFWSVILIVRFTFELNLISKLSIFPYYTALVFLSLFLLDSTFAVFVDE